MQAKIAEQLAILYGRAAAQRLAARVAELIQRFGPVLSPKSGARSPLPLSERDALLITYPDQLVAPAERPLATLGAFASRHLRGLTTGIHLLPFYPWSSDDGFSVRDFFQVDSRYGAWSDVARLGEDFDLMFDGVFNHVSVTSEWFKRFLAGEAKYREYFTTVEGQPDLSTVVRPRALPLLTEFNTALGPGKVWTTFSADQADLNFRNPEVLLAVLEALLFYVNKGARFIRLDAVAFLWKQIGTSCLHRPETHLLIQLMRTVLDESAPRVLLITETNVPHADNISYFGNGRDEAQLVYNFALAPLVLHSLQTGSARALANWGKSLELPSDSVTFFNFLASHDGIGLNPARGILSEAEIGALTERTLASGGFISYKHTASGSQQPYEMNINYLDALADPSGGESGVLAARKFLTAHAIMLCLQGLPGIYFHSLFGSRGNRALALNSGIHRRINREKLDCAKLENELADPGSVRSLVFKGISDLLRSRRGHPALAPQSVQTVVDVDPRVFCVLRESPEGSDRLLCLHNVSAEVVAVDCRLWLDTVVHLAPFAHAWLRF